MSDEVETVSIPVIEEQLKLGRETVETGDPAGRPRDQTSLATVVVEREESSGDTSTHHEE